MNDITTKMISTHRVVSREEWLDARKALLAKEKELTRRRDQLAAARRALPWVRVEKQYVFDAPQGPVTLADLFDGRSQLFVKHFMMGPGQESQCVGCSLEVDHLEGVLVHLQNHDVSYAVVARAPIEEIEAVRQRMGWRFPWVSSYRSDFNYDFHVSFTPDELAAGRAFYNYEYGNPGLEDRSGDSVSFKDEGRPHLPHLLDLRSLRRGVPRHLPISRFDSEGAERKGAGPCARRLGVAEEAHTARAGLRGG